MKKYFFVCIIFALLASCHNHDHDHSQEGHSHDTNLMLSGYSETYEIFAEAEPFAINKASNIDIFLSSMPDFKPAEIKQLTVSLVTGSQGVRQTVDLPLSPGIFQLKLMPEKAGEAKLVFDIVSNMGSSQVEISGINVYEDAHKAEHIAEEQAPDYPNAIQFSKQQQWKIDFASTFPASELFGQVIRTTAQIQSSQTDETIISARTSGIIVFSGNNLVDGQDVGSGQSLFTISGTGLAENNSNVRFIEAKNNFLQAEADYKRAQELVKDKIISEKDFLEIKGRYESAQAMYDNLHRNFSSQGQKISSPFPGFIKQVFVENGQYVEAGQSLISISKSKSLLLKADVQVKYASLLHSLSSANIRSMDKKEVYTLSDLNGKILSYGKSLNSDNYMLPVNIQVDNRAGFIPGGFVDIYLKTQSDSPVMTIPNSALTEEQGLFFVYVQLNPELFEKREVEIGSTDGVRTEVKSGLSLNERLVSKGAVSVKLAQSAGALDPHAGHVH